ncbi:MAG: type III pantothenate kinase [Chitinophagales bacterium]|nr:type III pantothenate kinase [Chitinophagales bacterium]MDW8272957.1 type III pantothenate kinase [Chitinophagales bacterium]
MNLVIDIGNTSVKAALFDKGKIVRLLNSFNEIKTAVDEEYLSACIVSKTGNDNPVEEFLEQQTFKVLRFSNRLLLPVINRYATPHTLGTDRLALVCGASLLLPETNVLCIDTGTCITYNFLNDKKEFLGGAISPGIQMRLKALHHFTANLPLVSLPENYDDEIPLVGNSTEQSILSGVFNGIVEEINGIIKRYQKETKSLKVVLTGAGGSFFSKKIRNPNRFIEHLQLIGLNYILEMNKD